MTLDFAQEAFRSVPSNKAAGDYLSALMAYEADDMIGDDTFHNGIAEVAYWLHYGKLLGEG